MVVLGYSSTRLNVLVLIMATYHFSARVIKRSQNKSTVAAAAYRAGESYYDEREGKRWDYVGKSVSHSEILTPDHTGDWAKDREELWNTVQNKERQWKNGQLARDIEIALPRELSLEENTKLIRTFAQENFVDKGMIADINIHEEQASDGEMNPHAHIMLTMKPIDEETGELMGAKNRDWNKKELLNEWRENWAISVNEAYEQHGITETVDHRSLVDQGLEREPEIHVGFQAHDIEQKQGYSERFARNEEIKERNRLAALAENAKELFLEQYRKAVAWVRGEEKELALSSPSHEQQAIYYNYGSTKEQGRELGNFLDRGNDEW